MTVVPATRWPQRPRPRLPPWLLLAALVLWQALAQAALVLDTEHAAVRLPAQAMHWVDEGGSADLAAAQAARAAGLFRTGGPGMRSGPATQAHWLHFELDVRTPHSDWMLALHSTAIDDVRFFGPFDSSGRELAPPVATGLDQPYASRPMGIERPAMRLRFEQAGRHEVYMRLQSRSSQSLDVSAWETVNYVQSRQHKRLFDGITYGILLTLLVYNFVLSYVFRKNSYGLYVLTCGAALFTLASFNGHAAHYLLGEWPWWQQRANTLGASLWILFSALFCRAFLELEQHLPLSGRLMHGLAGMAALAAVLSLAGHTAWSQHLVEVVAAAGTLLAVGSALLVWRQGFGPAMWYLGGQALLFVSALGVVGVNWRLLDAPFLLANGLQIGVVAEMLVFAYALSARVRGMRQRQTELRQRADDLAEAVATDSLTGLANRVGLSQRAQQLLSGGQAVSVMLLDLDRFKPVNDTHGHEVGDRLLIEVARRLSAQMREGDLVARLGGDEFVVLLATRHSPPQLAAVAQRLCDAVRQPVRDGDLLLSVDASIGIARRPEHGQTLTELLRHADEAMYRAKQSHSGFAFYEAGGMSGS